MPLAVATMTPGDWSIVAAVYFVIVFVAWRTQHRMRGVADFLAAGRSAGRYMLTISYGVAAVGAITVIAYFETYFRAGFALHWWEPITQGSILLAMLTGWVVYRFRRTRCLTLAEFFERRYSRRFRVFAGACAFLSGLLNFAIFPAVGSRFFVHFCGLPVEFTIGAFTLSTYIPVMALLVATALWFVFAGGQVTVLVTDFVQGVFSNFVFVGLTIYLLILVGWPAVQETLAVAPPGQSRINPLDTADVEDFGFSFFLIGAIGYFYARMSWQGEQAYYTSARTAHEAKMGGVLSLWQLQIRLLFLVVVPVLASVMLTHPAWTDVQTSVGIAMSEIEVTGVREQMRVPLVLADVLPTGVRGIMAAMMLAAFISTHNTYLHSWGSILVQDIVLPVAQSRGWHPSRTAHLRILRAGVVGVAVFAFGFSAFVYNPQQPVILYLALTGSLFVGWAGAVIIGGLYWARGTCAAAWASAGTGVFITTTSAIVSQMNSNFLATGAAFWGFADWLGAERVNGGARFVADHAPNGQQTWGLAMAACTLAYIGVSLFGRERANLDRLLHRRAFEMEGEVEHGRAPTRWGRLLAFTPEFTRRDRIIFLMTAIYVLGWFLLVVGGTAWAVWRRADDPVAPDSWLAFWHVRTWMLVVVAAGVTVWLTIGGIGNLRSLLRQLETQARDDSDDGLIATGNSARNKVHHDDGDSHASS